MEYTPVEWHTGDVITEEKLNSMVNGITEGVSEVLVANININEEVYTLDKTYKEIKESKLTIFKLSNGDSFSILTMYRGYKQLDTYYLVIITGESPLTLTTDNENGYPSSTQPT